MPMPSPSASRPPTAPVAEIDGSGRRRARVIPFYLPQFHPTPENDEWWGPGFTEWTNVAKMRPLFRGHRQPHLPADLGFYDLRLPETRQAQADLARAHGIDGFCYWHYWFGGQRILERPVNEVIESGEPKFPFCLAWANHSWTGVWHGSPDRTLIRQVYPGMDDHEAHFRFLMRAFSDERYLRIDGRPLFVVMHPDEVPDAERVTDRWRELAEREGLSGLYLVGMSRAQEHFAGFDATVTVRPLLRFPPRSPWRRVVKRALRRPLVYSCDQMWPTFVPPGVPGVHDYPCVFSNWDNTPRSGRHGVVLQGCTPELLRRQLGQAIARVEDRPHDDRVVFVKSWNEWAEGNYLEPDIAFGRGWLEAVRDEVLALPRP